MNEFLDEYEDDEDDPLADEPWTEPCQACGEPVYEDAPQCPYCGEYQLDRSSGLLAGKPAWWMWLILVLIAWLIISMTFVF